MKSFSIIHTVACLFLGLSLFLVGCSDPQKTAVKQLEENQYAFTVNDYLVAAGAGDMENMLLFMEAGMEIDTADSEGNTALIQAAANGRTTIVEKALGLGADPLHLNRYGRDALISASAKGYEEVARLLVTRGANLHVKDSEGWNALSIAAFNGHESLVSLLASQADQEMLDNSLLLAGFSGSPQVIQGLLSQGAYINTRSPENQTPLMIASSSGHSEAVRILLQNQANPYSTDDEGRTAAVLAEEKGHEQIRDLILEPGSWGETEEGMLVADEMKGAQDALVDGSVEEVLKEEESAPQNESGEQLASANETSSTNSGNPASAPGETPPNAPVAEGSIPVPGVTETSVAVTSRPAYEYPAPDRSPTAPTPSQIRETAKDRPMAALNGSVIKSRDPKKAAVETFVLASYRERPLPIAVKSVEGEQAQIQMLSSPNEDAVKVEKGSLIPGTNYQVEDVTTKIVSSKEGKGKLVDVSRVKVKDTRTGASHLLVKDVTGSTSDSYAILAAPGSDYRYVVKTGDTFRTDQPGVGERDYQVLDIRSTGVVIKDLTTGQVLTVARDGVIAP